jgi:hypothetical protein
LLLILLGHMSYVLHVPRVYGEPLEYRGGGIGHPPPTTMGGRRWRHLRPTLV